MLTITKHSAGVWSHNNYIVSKCFVEGNDDTEDFILSKINGQKPIETYNVSVITLVDDTTTTTYPTFATVNSLLLKLEELKYVGFDFGESSDPADLISADSPNAIVLGADGKLKVTAVGVIPPELITTGYTKATDFGNANFYPKAMFLDVPIQDDANTDIWLASTFTNQRVIHQFGEGVALNKISYVNGTRTVDGSGEGQGAKTVNIYALNADVDPTFTYGVTDANYTLIFSGDLAQYTIAQAKSPPELTLTSVPALTYGLVYDIMNNHDASGRIEIRRLLAHKSL